MSCTLCFDGSPAANLDGNSLAGGTSCTYLNSLVQRASAGTPGCLAAQISAFQGCGCTSYDTSRYCSMCDNDFFEIPARDKPVPLFPGAQCGDLLFSAIDSGRCPDVNRAAHHCTLFVSLLLFVSHSHWSLQYLT